MSFFSSSSSQSSERNVPVQTDADVTTTGTGDSYTAEERVVKESQSRSVPTYVDMPPRLDPSSSLLAPLSLDPVTVRWDYATPGAITPEHRLQQLDQEMRRLAREMSHLWGQSSSSSTPLSSDASRLLSQTATPFRQPGLHQSAMAYRDADMRRLWSQLDGGLEMKRLWNQAAGYGEPGYSAVPSFEPPSGFVRLSPPPLHSLMPKMEAVGWGAEAHPESWRRKEDFHIDNPITRDCRGQKQFRLEFDLRQFRPEEIEVRTDNRCLTVQARHEDNDSGKQVRREYCRQCTIPEGVDPRSVISQLNRSGILAVSAPLPALTEDTVRNIHVKSS